VDRLHDHLVIEYATAGKVAEKVAADEAIDVAILTKPRAEKLVRAAKLVGGTRHENTCRERLFAFPSTSPG
jgi:hypothetical protein